MSQNHERSPFQQKAEAAREQLRVRDQLQKKAQAILRRGSLNSLSPYQRTALIYRAHEEMTATQPRPDGTRNATYSEVQAAIKRSHKGPKL